MSMKNSNDIIGNRARGLPVCSAVLQPIASQRVPKYGDRTVICVAFCGVVIA